jgi:hypothetical protein
MMPDKRRFIKLKKDKIKKSAGNEAGHKNAGISTCIYANYAAYSQPKVAGGLLVAS